MAEVQTKGKGRGGKKWESPKGGLWFSILLRPDIPSNKVPLLQFLVANAARNALEEETVLRVLLKWPNDLVTPSGKLGGILVESKTLGDRVLFVVVGIGLNVNQPRPQLPAGASSLLLETGMRYERLRLLRAMVNQIRSRIDDIDEPSSILDEWWRNCIHRPPRVKLTTQRGSMIGITRGVDREGALILETEDHHIQKAGEGTLRLLDDASD